MGLRLPGGRENGVLNFHTVGYGNTIFFVKKDYFNLKRFIKSSLQERETLSVTI